MMARPNPSLALLLLLALWAQAAAAYDWITVKPGDGKFAIDMPGPPRESAEDIDTPYGPARMHIAELFFADDESYVATYIDYDAKVLEGRTSQQVLKAAQDAMLGDMEEGKLRLEAEIAIDGNPGRAFVIVEKGGIFYSVRSFLVGNRLYQNIAITRQQQASGPVVGRFLQSFVLTKP